MSGVHEAATAEVAPGWHLGECRGFDSPTSLRSAQYRVPVIEHGAPSRPRAELVRGEGGYGESHASPERPKSAAAEPSRRRRRPMTRCGRGGTGETHPP